MSSLLVDATSAPVPATGLPAHEHGAAEQKKENVIPITIEPATAFHTDDDAEYPTEEEMFTLRKVPATMPWVAIFMCFIELAERASYYGSTGPFNNFINNPLPDGGNGAGAVAPGAAGVNQSAGALGLGSVDASALTNMFTFLAYLIPIYGGIVADTKWGRFKTICVGTAVGAFAHVLLVIPAIPKVIAHPNGSLGAFIISILILAFAAGFIKPSLGPLLCDQIPYKVPTIQITKKGERVIVDPGITVERWLLIFYGCINVGGFFAVATEYAERFVGFWLAYLLPGIIYMLMPIVLVISYPRLYKAPPQGSVVVECFRVFKVLLANGGWKRMWKGGDDFWNRAKPSHIEAETGAIDRSVILWDDQFVEEVKQTVVACQVFALIPVFTLADSGNGGVGNSMNDMSVAMTLAGIPNDLLGNFNPLTIIIFTPILTFGLYPFMARIGHPLKPMTRMAIGFILGGIGCIIAAVIQARIYATSPCGNMATTCDDVSPVSLAWQIPIYFFPAVGELFVNVTSYELAYTRAPARMKGLVYALALVNSAVASAISLALADVVQDPWLVWPWVALAVASFLCAVAFPTYFRHLNIPHGDFASRERQAGLQQPKYIVEHSAEHQQAVENVETKH